MAGRGITGAIGAAEKARGRQYTPKQKKFLKLYAENNFTNSRECAELAGYKADHLKVVSELKEDIIEITKDLLLSHAPRAANAITGMLVGDDPIPNATARLNAAKEVLDRVGVVKPEKVEHEHKVTGGLFLIPTKQELVVEEAEYYEEEDES